jgi:hypothetical protein
MADWFREVGLTVVEEPGWEDRGRDWFDLVGMMQHHTACCSPYPVHKLYPTRAGQWRIRANFSIQPGPSASAPAKVHIIAAGRCNYSSGQGRKEVITDLRNDIPPSSSARGFPDTIGGNKHFINDELAHPGDGSPLPAPMKHAVDMTWLALCRNVPVLNANRLIGHAEFTGRKIDPYWNGTRAHPLMNNMRSRLAVNLGGDTLPPPPDPEPPEKEEDVKEFVLAEQQNLNAAGFTDYEGKALEEDGVLGKRTKSAMRKRDLAASKGGKAHKHGADSAVRVGPADYTI